MLLSSKRMHCSLRLARRVAVFSDVAMCTQPSLQTTASTVRKPLQVLTGRSWTARSDSTNAEDSPDPRRSARGSPTR